MLKANIKLNHKPSVAYSAEQHSFFAAENKTMNNRLVDKTITEETIDCCPLCQHDEFFISADKEKFYCAKCGFHTNTLTSIQPMLAAKANLTHRFVHIGIKTRQ